MSYLEFLREPYNLPFVVAAVFGVIAWFVRRSSGRFPGPLSPAFFVATGVVGLTVNGALHDLGLGDYGRRFPLILLASVVAGLVFQRVARRRGSPGGRRQVRFNDTGLAGRTAVVLSRPSASNRNTGRARLQDETGMVHIVRIHADDEAGIRFGMRVRLGRFDEKRQAYTVVRT